MSPELKQFYKDLQAWIEEGLPEDPIFDQRDSVYDNLWYWAFCVETCPLELRAELSHNLTYELRLSFEKAGLDTYVPFNTSLWKFYTEQNKYANKARLEWIRKQAMED